MLINGRGGVGEREKLKIEERREGEKGGALSKQGTGEVLLGLGYMRKRERTRGRYALVQNTARDLFGAYRSPGITIESTTCLSKACHHLLDVQAPCRKNPQTNGPPTAAGEPFRKVKVKSWSAKLRPAVSEVLLWDRKSKPWNAESGKGRVERTEWAETTQQTA